MLFASAIDKTSSRLFDSNGTPYNAFLLYKILFFVISNLSTPNIPILHIATYLFPKEKEELMVAKVKRAIRSVKQ